MVFERKNTYWQLAQNPGRPLSYQPEELYNKAREYMQYLFDNPIDTVVVSNREAVHVDKYRPATIQGFCVYIGISSSAFYEYEKRNEFLEIIARIRDLFFSQKIEGAAAGIFDGNIVARELKLFDSQPVALPNININIQLPDNDKHRLEENNTIQVDAEEID